MAAAKEPVLYVTSHVCSTLFDILAKGVTIRGNWHDYPLKKIVVFSVPQDLVESFEAHYHFQSGNIIKYVPTSEPINGEPKKEKSKKEKVEPTPDPVPPVPPVLSEGEGA